MKVRTIYFNCFCLLLTCLSAFSQSSFWLSNLDGRGVNAPVFDSNGIRLEGSNFRAELWGGPTTESVAPAFSYFSHQRVTTPFLTGAGAGYFRDFELRLGPGDDPSIFAVPPRGWAWLQVRVWDVRVGETYEDAMATGLGGYGESAVLFAQGGDPTLLPPDSPGALLGLQSFSLRPIVPEPSTWALLLVGGASALRVALRRRRIRN